MSGQDLGWELGQLLLTRAEGVDRATREAMLMTSVAELMRTQTRAEGGVGNARVSDVFECGVRYSNINGPYGCKVRPAASAGRREGSGVRAPTCVPHTSRQKYAASRQLGVCYKNTGNIHTNGRVPGRSQQLACASCSSPPRVSNLALGKQRAWAGRNLPPWVAGRRGETIPCVVSDLLLSATFCLGFRLCKQGISGLPNSASAARTAIACCMQRTRSKVQSK